MSVDVGVDGRPGGAVQCVEGGHVLGIQHEVEDREVLPEPHRIGRLRDRDQAVLDVPAEHDLRRTAAVLERRRAHSLGVEQLAAPAQRAVGLDRDAVVDGILPLGIRAVNGLS